VSSGTNTYSVSGYDLVAAFSIFSDLLKIIYVLDGRLIR
jgi:hypothetical protein